MTTYADPTRCPDCGSAIAAPPTSCPGCGLPLSGPVASSLFQTLQSADRLLAELRASRYAVTAPGPGLPRPISGATVQQPPSGEPRRSGLSGASVPKILLTLGALCLLVAAVIFLAVAWSRLGVGGRTAVLLAMTALAASLAWWFDRRGLRVAAESLTVVAFGLLVLDVVGADSAGWFGDLSASGLVVTVGSVVGMVGSVTSYLTTRRAPSLVAPQLFAALGLWAVPAGAADLLRHDALVFMLACAAFAGLALVAHRLRVGLLPWLAAAAAVTWWLPLAGVGLVRLADHPSLRGLWLRFHAWPMLAAAALLLIAVWALRRAPELPSLFAGSVAGLSALLTTLVVAFPALDEPAGTAVPVTLAATAVWAVALLLAPDGWRAAATLPMLASLALPTAVGLDASGTIAESALRLVGPWDSPASVHLAAPSLSIHPLLLVLIAVVIWLSVVALSRWAPRIGADPRSFARRNTPLLAGFVGLAAVVALAAYDVPLALLLTGLLVLTAALVALGVTGGSVASQALLAVAVVPAAAATVLSLAAVWLTLVTLVAVLVGAVVVAVRGREEAVRLAATTLVPAVGAGIVWTAGELAGLDEAWRGVPVLLLVGALALLRPRLPVEVPAALAGVVASAAAVVAAFDHSDSWGQKSLALHLTVAGALVTASALLHPSRRLLGYPGGVLLAMATWVRLNELGVTTPEAYTLPSAVALLVLGVQRLRRDPRASTLASLGAGLSLATLPSLLRVLVDEPITVRALLLGLGCLALVLLGVRLRWTAPLVVGAVVGGLLVLREAGPYAADLPSWVVIALAGSVLTLVGVTWESRLKNLRDAGDYLAHLR